MRFKVRHCFSMALIGCLLALTSGQASVAAQDATPFKLGAFQTGSKEFLGLVLGDNRVLDITAANAAFEKRNPRAGKIRIPADMNELIARYDQDVGPRLRKIAAANAESSGAAYTRPLSEVRI